MGNSYSAEVWLDERRWDALEAALEEQGTNIEKYRASRSAACNPQAVRGHFGNPALASR